MIFVPCFVGVLYLASKLKAEDEPTELFSSNRSCHSGVAASSYLLISTVDGKISCLNAHLGTLEWTVPSTKPLVSSSISSMKSMQDMADMRFIPSLDGNLYKWIDEKLESIPLSVEFLLGNIVKLPDGSYVVGGKETSMSGVDIQTGKIAFDCSSSGCHATKCNEKVQEKDILNVRRVQQTIRVVDQRSGIEKWNFSVGSFEMEYIGSAANQIPLQNLCKRTKVEELNFEIQDGILSSAGQNDWTFQFSSPISQAWMLESGTLEQIDIFKYGLMVGLPHETISSWLYMGTHEGQMYIQQPLPSSSYKSSHDLQVSLHPYLKHWKPFISTSASRTPALSNNRESLDVMDYPYDNGFILTTSNTTPHDLSTIDPSPSLGDTCPIVSSCSKYEYKTESAVNPDDGGDHMVSLSLSDWWKEILLLSVIFAVGINVAVRFVKKKLVATNMVLNKSGASSEAIEEFHPSPHKSSSIETVVGKSVSESNSDEYSSRYLVDFNHLECLGKGGFGVVFKAKKRIDDCDYAIKRIYLPRCEDAKEKMMREVKALAALDHPGIVRYFHAWWEAPPNGWQLCTDRQHLKISHSSTVPSYTLSNDWILEVKGNFETRLRLSEHRSQQSSLCDDPLGRRYNFDTGVEQDFSLLTHNDVFFEDNDSAENSEDSFIVFDSSDDGKRNRKKTLTTENVNESGCSSSTANELSSSVTTRRVVGKCCSKSASCLTEPPLFLYIQMQLCRQATLKDWLSEKSRAVTLPQAMDIFMQIVNAVEYFHGLGMMHRDLKPANIFFSLDGSVKVGDFGLVTAITRPSDGHKGRAFVDENHTGQVGTQLYMSPEQVTGKPYNHKVDVYSLGLILFELLCSFSTQMERMETIYQLKSGVLPSSLESTPQGNLVCLLTATDQMLRPEAYAIKSLQFTNEIETLLAST